MSMGDILDTEIERRRLANADLIAAQADIDATIEQFNKLDEIHRSNEKVVRERLEAVYKESRHYTGKQPVVYSFAQTEKFPFYGGQLDAQCNPYFPITKVQDKTFDGLGPLYAPPTRTGAWARDVAYTPSEPSVRIPALAAVAAFPDISGEVGAGTPPNLSYPPGSTATEKLRSALNAWRPEVVALIADIWNAPAEVSYWQNILAKIDDILPYIQSDVSYPAHTSDFSPGSVPDLARDYLIANTAAINTHVNNRAAILATQTSTDEELFFGVIKLRLHQANGSLAKLQTAKSQKVTNQSIVNDNLAAIRSLNLLKVKSS